MPTEPLTTDDGDEPDSGAARRAGPPSAQVVGRRRTVPLSATEALDGIEATAAGAVRISNGNDTATGAGRPGAPGAQTTQISGFEVIRPLGHGGMGSVYLARDTRLARLVAIKSLIATDPGFTNRFLAEARITARLQHENIVVIHEVGEHAGHPYMVLEYLEGRTLRTWLEDRSRVPGTGPKASSPVPPVPPQLAIDLLIPVVRALVYAHAQGIVHRDLKPENIFVTDAGVVKVLDFGIATSIARVGSDERTDDASSRTNLGLVKTAAGAVLGTLPYMSPEQRLADRVDHRSDIWAVGIILFELLTGHHPLAGSSTPGTRGGALIRADLQQVTDLTAPMPSMARDTDDDLGSLVAIAAIVDRCLIKRQSDRTPSARVLLTELQSLSARETSSGQTTEDSPYPGLTAFQQADAGRFFGRTGDVSGALRQLREQPLLTIIGPSGIGKSSFVRAGLIPALRASGEGWDAHIIRPGRHPLTSLAHILGADSVARGRARLAENPAYLGVQLRQRSDARLRRTLLFVDQFEELYTLCASADERALFIECLQGAADDAWSPVRVVVTMRADFLERAAAHSKFFAQLTRALRFLPPMQRAGLRDALVCPAQRAGYRFASEAMVERMLDDLESTPGALPLLQFTADQLWATRDRQRQLITEDGYRQVGGVAGALAEHADATVASLSQKERALARQMFERLVTPERTRAMATLAELNQLAPDPERVAELVERLVNARLLVVESGLDHSCAQVEIVHESLIASWPLLGQWLDEHREHAAMRSRVRTAARDWQAGERADGLLWRGDAEREARRFVERYPGTLAAGERAYLEAVLAFADRTRNRRRRLLGAIGVVLVAVASCLGYLAWRERVAKRDAQAQKGRALDALRTLHAAARSAADPTTAAVLLREVSPEHRDEAWNEQAQSLRHATIARAVMSEHQQPVHAVVYDPSGRLILTASEDGTARVYRADGSGTLAVLSAHVASVQTAAFSPDGRRVVTGSKDGRALLWRLPPASAPESVRAEQVAVLVAEHGSVAAASFSPDGTRVLTASADGFVQVRNVSDERPDERPVIPRVIVLEGHEQAVHAARFDSRGERVATGSEDDTARVWSLTDPGAPLVFEHGAPVHDVAFSPDGRNLATASADHRVRVFAIDGTGVTQVLDGFTTPVKTVAFSPDGRRVLASADETMALSWPVSGPGDRIAYGGHFMTVHRTRFSPDGRFVVTASGDQRALVWSADGRGHPLSLHGHSDMLSDVAFSPDSERVATASADATVRVWATGERRAPIELGSHGDKVVHAEFSPDDSRVVTASWDGKARVFDALRGGRPIELAPTGLSATAGEPAPERHLQALAWAAFSPDGTRIATASWDGTARIHTLDKPLQPVVLTGHTAKVTRVIFSPDGERVATASVDHSARVYRADGSGQAKVMTGHTGHVYDIAFSPDGRYLATASVDHSARLFHTESAAQAALFTGHERQVMALAFSPDGTRLYTGSYDATVRAWAMSDDMPPVPRPVRVLDNGSGLILTLDVSSDGRALVTGSFDGVARVWRLDRDERGPLALRGHEDRIWHVAFAPNQSARPEEPARASARRVLTVSGDGTARVFSLPDDSSTERATGASASALVLSGHSGAVFHGSFSSTGERLVTASHDGSARVWPMVWSGAGDTIDIDRFLWSSTSYCPSARERHELLKVSLSAGGRAHRRCVRRVRAARASANARLRTSDREYSHQARLP